MRRLRAGREDTIGVSQTMEFELTPFREVLGEKLWLDIAKFRAKKIDLINIKCVFVYLRVIQKKYKLKQKVQKLNKRQ